MANLYSDLQHLEETEYYKACHFRALEDQVCSLTIGDDRRLENRTAQESLSVDRRYSKLLAKYIELLQAHPTSIAPTHEAGDLAETHMTADSGVADLGNSSAQIPQSEETPAPLEQEIGNLNNAGIQDNADVNHGSASIDDEKPSSQVEEEVKTTEGSPGVEGGRKDQDGPTLGERSAGPAQVRAGNTRVEVNVLEEGRKDDGDEEEEESEEEDDDGEDESESDSDSDSDEEDEADV